MARILDLNVYINFVVFTLKHLLQEIRVNNLDWNDTLPSELGSKWFKLIQEVPLLLELFNVLSTYVNTNIIGFSDTLKTGMCNTLES